MAGCERGPPGLEVVLPARCGRPNANNFLALSAAESQAWQGCDGGTCVPSQVHPAVWEPSL